MITPIIGHWYKAYCGSPNPIYTIRLDSINKTNFSSSKWKFGKEGWQNSSGGFSKLIEEIPCPEEFNIIINDYQIY